LWGEKTGPRLEVAATGVPTRTGRSRDDLAQREMTRVTAVFLVWLGAGKTRVQRGRNPRAKKGKRRTRIRYKRNLRNATWPAGYHKLNAERAMKEKGG